MGTHEIYRAAMDTFGVPNQIIKLVEETGEFFEAFGKCLGGRDKVSHVAEEMADVHNMLDQWAVHLGCVDEVERQKRYKLKRLEQRIEKARSDAEKPLTFEELQGMMGEPVWIVDKIEGGGCRWEIVRESLLGLFAGYNAYRKKPREVIGDV